MGPVRMRLGSEVINQDRRQLLSTAAKGIAAAGTAIAVVLAVLGSRANSAQDKLLCASAEWARVH
jgi:hypothetical protein